MTNLNNQRAAPDAVSVTPHEPSRGVLSSISNWAKGAFAAAALVGAGSSGCGGEVHHYRGYTPVAPVVPTRPAECLQYPQVHPVTLLEGGLNSVGADLYTHSGQIIPNLSTACWRTPFFVDLWMRINAIGQADANQTYRVGDTQQMAEPGAPYVFSGALESGGPLPPYIPTRTFLQGVDANGTPFRSPEQNHVPY